MVQADKGKQQPRKSFPHTNSGASYQVPEFAGASGASDCQVREMPPLQAVPAHGQRRQPSMSKYFSVFLLSTTPTTIRRVKVGITHNLSSAVS